MSGQNILIVLRRQYYTRRCILISLGTSNKMKIKENGRPKQSVSRESLSDEGTLHTSEICHDMIRQNMGLSSVIEKSYAQSITQK